MPITLALWLVLIATQSTPAPPVPSQPPAATPAPPPPQSPAEKRAAYAKMPCAPGPSGAYIGALGMRYPITTYAPGPDFPAEARKYKITYGVVNLTVDEKGRPTNVHAVRPASATADPKLQDAQHKVDQSAVDAIQKYRFEPATCNGVKVPVELNIQVYVDFF